MERCWECFWVWGRHSLKSCSTHFWGSGTIRGRIYLEWCHGAEHAPCFDCPFAGCFEVVVGHTTAAHTIHVGCCPPTYLSYLMAYHGTIVYISKVPEGHEILKQIVSGRMSQRIGHYVIPRGVASRTCAYNTCSSGEVVQWPD